MACLLTHFVCAGQVESGPLRISDVNPRYFTDNSGRAILLTGSHTWNNLVDIGPSDPPPELDYDAYLDWMEGYHHNFMQLWAWELLSWSTAANNADDFVRGSDDHTIAPHPFPRSGPGLALDGKPKFDLSRVDPAYLARLRDRVERAGDRGIYTAVMLFEGWGMRKLEAAWVNHPFHPENNINGIDGDVNGDGSGVEIHELENREVTAIQEMYVRAVINAVNDLDNVLFEIINESQGTSTLWQYHMIDFVHAYEGTLSKQHPVGMTVEQRDGTLAELLESPAEWISPRKDDGFRDNPPAADGRKVIISDTDHLWGFGGSQAWVWKSFCRGLNPIFMDGYDGLVLGNPFDQQWEPIRLNMGYVRQLAEYAGLIDMTPRNTLASSEYCLANPGQEYIVYIPEGPDVTVDLTAASGEFSVKWLNPSSGEKLKAAAVSGGHEVILTTPFDAPDAVVYLKSL